MNLKEFIEKTVKECLNDQEVKKNIIEASAYEIKNKYYPNIKQEYFDKIISSDKLTSNLENGKVGKYAKWLLKIYSQGNLDLNDLDRAENYLKLFDKLIKANKIEKNDINKYNSLEDVYKVIFYYLEDKTISKGDEKRNVKKNAKKIYEDNKFIVIEPLTKEASCYYGKGTQWCASGDHSDNRFSNYKERGNIYIIIDKSKRNDIGDYSKYMIHFNDGEYKNELNKEINFDKNLELKNVIKKIIKIVKIKPIDLINFRLSNIRFIDNPDEDIQLKVLKKFPDFIKYIENPTINAQLFAINKNPFLIDYIKNPSKEIIDAAININPETKEYIDRNYDIKKKELINFYKQDLELGLITKNEYDDYVNYL
jgi:hypothetical protein